MFWCCISFDSFFEKLFFDSVPILFSFLHYLSDALNPLLLPSSHLNIVILWWFGHTTIAHISIFVLIFINSVHDVATLINPNGVVLKHSTFLDLRRVIMHTFAFSYSFRIVDIFYLRWNFGGIQSFILGEISPVNFLANIFLLMFFYLFKIDRSQKFPSLF